MHGFNNLSKPIHFKKVLDTFVLLLKPVVAMQLVLLFVHNQDKFKLIFVGESDKF